MRIFLTLIFVLSVTGCFRTRLDAPVAGGHLLRDRQHFFFFGLIGDNDINLKAECPTGVTSFEMNLGPPIYFSQLYHLDSIPLKLF